MDIIAFYTKEVLANRPAGISQSDMERLLSAWLNIERWGGEMKEYQIRRAARMALSKAGEILSVRKEVREQKGEEEIIKKESERSVFERALGGEKDLYPLTELKETSQLTEIPTPPQNSAQTVMVAEDSSLKTENTSNKDAEKPPQSSTTEIKESGSHTTELPFRVDVSRLKTPTPLLQSSLKHYPRSAETLAAMAAQNPAGKKAWINDVRTRLETPIPQSQSDDISNRL
jgi:hypothetical protein